MACAGRFVLEDVSVAAAITEDDHHRPVPGDV
jgi:hypothetical protein